MYLTREVSLLKGTVVAIDLNYFIIKIAVDDKSTFKFISCGWYLLTHKLELPQVDKRIIAYRVYEAVNNAQLVFLKAYSAVIMEAVDEDELEFGPATFIIQDNPFLKLVTHYKLEFDEFFALHEPFFTYEGGLEMKLVSASTFNLTLKNAISCDINWYFAHSVHHNSNDEHLIGYLHNCDDYLHLRLSDFETDIKCEILTENCFNLTKYVERVLLIKKFMVITEKYETRQLYTKCLVVNESDIEILKTSENRTDLIEKVFLCNNLPAHFKDVLKFRLIVKGIPNSTKFETIECWMIIEILNPLVIKEKEINLCLETSYFQVIPFLEVGETYNLHLTSMKALFSYQEYEISKLDPSRKSLKLRAGEGIFSKNTEHPFIPIALADDTNLNGIINAKAVITEKYFDKPDLQSRTKSHMINENLGTKGKFMHTLHLQMGNLKTRLFLNNWERRLTPRLLIPNMEIEIRSAKVGNNYLRSNGMTSFKLLKYHHHHHSPK